MNTIDTLKNTLLVFTILVLLYVLYKRLVQVLRKDVIEAKYPEIGNAIVWEEPRKAHVDVLLKRETALQIELYSSDGSLVNKIAEGSFGIGQHQFALSLDGLQAGKYYYKVISEHQQASQYFELA